MKTRPVHILSLAILLVTLISTGCGGTSAPNPATATAQAVRAANLGTQIAGSMQATHSAESASFQATSEVRQALTEAARSWPVVVQESFDDNQLEWPAGENSDPLADIAWKIEDGVYRWQSTAKQGFIWWATPGVETNVNDFYLAADVRQIDGPPDSEFGLAFRVESPESYYLFELAGQGSTAVFLLQDENWQTLMEWSQEGRFQPEEWNRMAVLASGNRFIFFVNDQMVGELQEDTIGSGSSGVFIGLFSPEDSGTWEFDNFELRSQAP